MKEIEIPSTKLINSSKNCPLYPLDSTGHTGHGNEDAKAIDKMLHILPLAADTPYAVGFSSHLMLIDFPKDVPQSGYPAASDGPFHVSRPNL